MRDKYLIDANVFMTAHRQLYPFDLVPSFWEQLVEKASNRIVIIEAIEKEIRKGQDLLVEWYERERANFRVLGIPGPEVIQAYRVIIKSINANGQYKPSAKREFASSADSWLCAYGLALGETIVTLEKYEADIKKKVKIPNVCREFGIEYIDLLQFMREIGIRL
ncbi:MAG: DUF4411 family protein [Clostridia bacterium]|jgi:hypothetical protein|nr:DUF4411 family protein [Clostridia bacterium]